ncbi:hypothetical protein HID58_058389 [Brassica napus]|uniref:Protein TRIGALACTOSYLDIACYLGLYCEROL 4, chloroplastic n=1 Tax=Brassica napus TaxID=3708 RepID=A0ABQ7ZQK0_BRANA|nr:hypothetical protein HID58_058389 [Brassica napus]
MAALTEFSSSLSSAKASLSESSLLFLLLLTRDSALSLSTLSCSVLPLPTGLVGQFKPKKLFADIKTSISKAEEWDLQLFKDTTKHIVDKSLYSVGLWTQIALGSSSSLLLNAERLGDKKGIRKKLMFLEKHDLTVEAAWPDLFLDHKGRFWDVPESLNFDVSSLAPETTGLQYRFGVHKSKGDPQQVNAAETSGDDAPASLFPGLCAKAAVSYKASRDLWRPKERDDDTKEEEEEDDDDDSPVFLPYDIRLKEPHAAVSGIVGSTLAAWITGREDTKRSPISADAFGSACCTFQKGRFSKLYGDLTRVDARVDVSSASALAKRIFHAIRRSSGSNKTDDDASGSPRLSLIFQQQVAGPIVFKVDSQFEVGAGKYGAQMEDLIYSLNYSLRLLESGKVVAWYSPKRKEGMVELRVFEF